MICYRDMMFCGAYEECAEGDSCFRALTPAVTEGAKYAETPISQFMVAPECFKEKTDE